MMKSIYPNPAWKRLSNFFVLFVMGFILVEYAYPQKTQTIEIGKKETIPSKVLEKDIRLSLHIPSDYDTSKERYPILITFQTHFEQVAGAVKNLYDYKLIPKTIVVRVDGYEFGYLTPTKIESNPNSGKADLFLRFFKHELFPYLDRNYRTHPYRIVFSNSWGAMFAAYSILAKPDVFNAAIASIPWLPYDGEEKFMLRNSKRFLKDGNFRNFLYMAMDDESVILPDLDSFLRILRKHPQEGLDWEYHYWPDEDHTSTPYRSIYSGLRALYKGWNKIPIEVANKGIDAIKDFEAGLNKKFGYPIGVSSVALRVAGQELKNDKRYDVALAIYEYAVEKSPNDSFVYVNLGRAYEESGKLEQAKKAYEKGYEIAVATSDPQIKWVKNFVDRINKKLAEVKE